MAMQLVRRNARSMPWVTEETLVPMRRQDSTDRDVGPRTSKSPCPSESPDSRILRGYYGPKDLETPAHLISNPRLTPRSKKCPRTDGENPDLQVLRPRAIVSSAGHNHGREKRHEAVHPTIAREIQGPMG